MAAVQPNQPGIKPAQGVQTHLALPYSPEADLIGVGDPEVGVDVVEVPLEGLTLQVLPQRHSLFNAEKIFIKNVKL